MRIVYGLTSLGMGGAERQVLALADRMAQRGHTVALMVLRAPVAEQWPTALRVEHLGMESSLAGFLAGIGRGRKFLEEFQPDLVHANCVHANLMARTLRLYSPHAKVISTIHNVNEGGWRRMVAYRLTDPLSATTTAVSEAARNRYIRLGAVTRRKSIVLTNGIDLKEFHPDPARRALMRAEMNILPGNFVWLTAGRITEAKDYPNLLRAFVQVKTARHDAQLWIAGESNARDVKKLKEISGVREMGDAVRWLGLRRDMPALYDAADGFVLASAWEGLPLALAEAMAMEKAVVATDVGGVRELVGDEGEVVPPGNPNALAQAMGQIIDLRIHRQMAMGRLARQRIAKHFNIEDKVIEWETLYLKVLGRAS